MTADRVVSCFAFFLIGISLARSVFLQRRLARLRRECEWRDANLQRAVYDLCQWVARLDGEAPLRFHHDSTEDRYAGRN